MARIRTIKPQFFKNEEVADLPAMTRLFFIGLWTLADRDGRLEDRPKRIKADIFPYDNYDAEKGLEELKNAGFILRYKVNVNASGRVLIPEQPTTELALIQIVTFSIHQRFTGKEAQEKSQYPPPYSGEAMVKHSGSNGEATGNPGMEYGIWNKEGNMEYGFSAQNSFSSNNPEEKSNLPPPPLPPPAPATFFRPGPESLEMELPAIKIGSNIERVKYAMQVSITNEDVLGMWKVFKTEYFTGEKTYRSIEAIYQHFGNWLKEQKFTKNGKSNQQGLKPTGAATAKGMGYGKL